MRVHSRFHHNHSARRHREVRCLFSRAGADHKHVYNPRLMKFVDGCFGFLVNEVGRLYSQQFDRLAREKLGLSQAQCRLLVVLARHKGEQALSQAELAQRMDLTPMAVATLCDRMAVRGGSSGGRTRRTGA